MKFKFAEKYNFWKKKKIWEPHMKTNIYYITFIRHLPLPTPVLNTKYRLPTLAQLSATLCLYDTVPAEWRKC